MSSKKKKKAQTKASSSYSGHNGNLIGSYKNGKWEVKYGERDWHDNAKTSWLQKEIDTLQEILLDRNNEARELKDTIVYLANELAIAKTTVAKQGTNQ